MQPSFQPVQQAAVSAVVPIPLLRENQPRLSQIAQGPAGGGFRQLQILGDGGNRGPAFMVFVSAVGQVYVHRDRPVGQIHSVKLCKIPH